MANHIYWFEGRPYEPGYGGGTHLGQVVYVGLTTRDVDVRWKEHWETDDWVTHASAPPLVLQVPDHLHLRAIEQLVIDDLLPTFNHRRADGNGPNSATGTEHQNALTWYQPVGRAVVLRTRLNWYIQHAVRSNVRRNPL
jgi:hypothetical protein